MAKGSQLTKTKKNDSTPASRKPNKTKTTGDKGAEKPVSADQVRCVDCENVIADDTKALNCENCLKVWKCTSCIGIRASTYDDLVSDAGNTLVL